MIVTGAMQKVNGFGPVCFHNSSSSMQSLIKYLTIIHFYSSLIRQRAATVKSLKCIVQQNGVTQDHILQLFEFIMDFHFVMASLSPAPRRSRYFIFNDLHKNVHKPFLKIETVLVWCSTNCWFIYACTFNVMQVVPLAIWWDRNIMN